MENETKIKKVSNAKVTKKKVVPLAICGVVFLVIIVAVIISKVSNRNSVNYVTVFNKVLSTKVGNFRYVVEVDSSEHSDKTLVEKEELSVSEMTSVEGDIGESENVEENDVGKHANQISDSWSNTAGSATVDWVYPSYKIIITGRTESIEPLRANMNVQVSTPYSNGELFDVTVVDDKYYINLSELRTWLSTSTDKKLADLADVIPESAVYMTLNEGDIHFYSVFAEDSEYEVSGTTSVDEFYNRFLILEQTLVSNLDSGLSKNAFGKSGTKYTINIKDDDSVTVYANLKNCLNNAGSMYNSYIKNLQNNGQMTDEQASQAMNEKDNFLTYIKDKWVWLNSASTSDLKARNLVITGVADQYTNDNGEYFYEVDCTVSFTDTDKNKDILVTINGSKSPLSATKDSVAIPTGTLSTKSDLGLGDSFTNLIKSLIKYFDVLDLYKEVKLDKTSVDVVNSMLNDFTVTVNKTNLGAEGFTPITVDSVNEFISKYANSEGGTELDKSNTKLVKDLLISLNSVTGNTVVKEVVKEEADIEQFREVTADVTVVPSAVKNEDVATSLDTSVKETEGTYKIIANIVESESNTNLAVIDAVLLNTSDHDMTIDLSRLSLQDMSNNKYPCNYETKLHEYDNGFDITQAPVSVTIPVNGYVEVKLYSVIENGWRYYDLFSGNDKLGDIVAY